MREPDSGTVTLAGHSIAVKKERRRCCGPPAILQAMRNPTSITADKGSSVCESSRPTARNPMKRPRFSQMSRSFSKVDFNIRLNASDPRQGFANACAIRMSYCLNHSGIRIHPANGKRFQALMAPFMSTKSAICSNFSGYDSVHLNTLSGRRHRGSSPT
jgi:hypothetical protein